MSITLSNKERTLLEDQKNHEQVCIEKYTNYANQAQDSQLRQIFQQNAIEEVEHLNSINSLLNGEVPDLNNKSQQSAEAVQASQTVNNAISSQASQQTGLNKGCDKELCTDMLMTEKYVSGAYDTSIFEFTDTGARDVLNHIQKEEQKHGEAIFKYMNSKGMYNVQ
ncbi:spore coat protein [Clostridium sp. cel8]|jgi:spore coat protein CotF|uniref:spore coat protein n=1 Tax=unclassified Clostridium TaxID=2614128 RepID=UPI0015F6E5AD|nr:spore coat protein [Clostridium sp. cel8]MBA5850054.1 spore coat protein [Clostridium sp. cel8]